MRLQLVLAAIGVEFFCPRLKGNITNIQLSWKLSRGRDRKLRVDRIARIKVDEALSATSPRKPYAQLTGKRAQADSPVSLSRSRTRGGPSALAALSALCESKCGDNQDECCSKNEYSSFHDD